MRFIYILPILASFLCLNFFSYASAQKNPISLEQNEGINELLTSNYRTPFWRLVSFYETQKTNTFCGVASSVMILNALGIQRPQVAALGNHGFYTQDNYFTPSVNRIVQEKAVLKRGMHLEEVTAALATFSNVKVETIYTSTVSLSQFRSLLKQALQSPNTFVIANYLRNYVGQSGSGHYSPIGAYNEKTDRVLILDVSRYRYTAAWVQLKDLYKSTKIVSSGRIYSRGIVLVSSNQPATYQMSPSFNSIVGA